MTNQEVYRRALNEIVGTAYGRDQCHEETMRLAAAALEKQIPKKPRKEKNIYGKPGNGVELEEDVCSSCGRTIVDEISYCYHCGQALNWGGVGDDKNQ